MKKCYFRYDKARRYIKFIYKFIPKILTSILTSRILPKFEFIKKVDTISSVFRYHIHNMVGVIGLEPMTPCL